MKFKSVFFYLKKSFTFFDLKAKTVPPVIFIAILAFYAASIYVMQLDTQQAAGFIASEYLSPEGSPIPIQMSYSSLAAAFVIAQLINVASFVYLDAAIREAKNEDYSAKDCVKSVFKKSLRLIGVSIVKNILFTVGMLCLIIPAIIMAIILFFAECAILDKDSATFRSLRFSRELTRKRRGDIFKIVLFCNLIIAFFIILLLSVFSANNPVVFQFILLFTLSVASLVELKLTAYLYADALTANAIELIAGDGGEN